MKTRKREIAKVGIFGSLDNPTIVTEKDLKEIVETFPDQKTAPIQFGHWADAVSPRLGNVVGVVYDEDKKSLWADVEEHDVLYDAVESGFYPDVSIGAKQRATDGKMYLHHLAYLGEEPPAIKDLKKEIQDDLKGNALVASDKNSVISFPSIQAKRLYLSDVPINEEHISIMETGKKPPVDPPSGGKSPEPNKKQEESSMTSEEEKALREENARLKTANEQKEKLLSDTFATQRAAEKEILKKSVAGKLSVTETEKLMLLADSFEVDKTILLSDNQKESPVTLLAGIFEKMPRKVEPGSVNLSDEYIEPQATPAIEFSKI